MTHSQFLFKCDPYTCNWPLESSLLHGRKCKKEGRTWYFRSLKEAIAAHFMALSATDATKVYDTLPACTNVDCWIPQIPVIVDNQLIEHECVKFLFDICPWFCYHCKSTVVAAFKSPGGVETCCKKSCFISWIKVSLANGILDIYKELFDAQSYVIFCWVLWQPTLL